MQRGLRVVAAAAAMTVLGIVAPASAHVQTVLDGDDSDGPVDVVAARLSHERRQVTLRVVTYETWQNATLSSQGGPAGRYRFAAFELDLDGDDRPDRCIAASWTNDVMSDPNTGFYRPTVYESCTYAPEDETGTGTWARPDDHTLVLHVARSLFAPKAEGAFRWRAVTSYAEEGDGNGPCRADGETEPHPYGPCTDFTRWTTHRP
jgi:hypothetical protein